MRTLDEYAEKLMAQAVKEFELTNTQYDHFVAIASKCASRDGVDIVEGRHILEALSDRDF